MPPNPGLSPQPPIISMEDDEMSDQEMVCLQILPDNLSFGDSKDKFLLLT